MKAIITGVIFVLLTLPASAQRTVATSNPVIYFAPQTGCSGGYWGTTSNPVTSCGSDIPGCGTMSQPCATPQVAINDFYQNWDFNGQYAPILNLACAAAPGNFFYPGITVSGLMVGQPGGFPPLVYGDGSPPFPLGIYAPVQIIGCPSNPFGAFINPNPSQGRPATIGLMVAGGARVRASGLAVDTTYAEMDCIDVFNSILDIDHLVWGNSSIDNKRIQMGIYEGTVFVNGDLAIFGHAGSWIEAGQDGKVIWNTNGVAPNMTVRLATNLSFSNGMIYANAGNINLPHVSFVHTTLNALNQFVDDATTPTITGNVVFINENGVIETGTGPGPQTCPASYFPQTSSGAVIVRQDNAVCR